MKHVADSRKQGRRYRVAGLVQGVGFRPTVWRLARQLGLNGHVLNDAAGVEIEAFGNVVSLSQFEGRLRKEAPPLSHIDSITWEEIEVNDANTDFVIRESRTGSVTTGIVPDAAICRGCFDDIFAEGNRRKDYAFTNCTHCGPRLSIIRGIPYDRANTSMSDFPMCDDCLAEYSDSGNRRFHAQPNACPRCGPRLSFEDAAGGAVRDEALQSAIERLRSGKIVAIKGIGGFHLACDATNEKSVATLRARKHRPSKPLAIMVRDLDMARGYAHVDTQEAALLASPVAPIVLVASKKDTGLAALVAPGQDRLGLMLPYTPLHALLMAQLDFPLIMTSGNRTNEPQVTGNDEARNRLKGIADGWLTHDRDIVNRLDDSVMRVDGQSIQIIRRARGLAPEPLPLYGTFSDAKRVLAMGGELKSTFCLLAGGQAILSQHIGDLEEAITYADYRRNLELYLKLFDFKISVVPVQHHHAHFASCLAENGFAADIRVLSIVLDGLGIGDDGTLWGGEILLGNCRQFERLAHFLPVAMPGGGVAAREPWRNLIAHLRTAYGDGWRDIVAEKGLLADIAPAKLQIADQMIACAVNSPLASSAGRLFDAVGAAIGICVDRQEFEGQVGMELEALAAPHMQEVKPYPSNQDISEDETVLSWRKLWDALLEDIAGGMSAGHIAARFHLGLVDAITRIVVPLASQYNVSRIALSGGAMNNRILFGGLASILTEAGLEVIVHHKVPANDGGLALGQAVVAACNFSER